ncbi:hypothetical protein H6G74_19310 [Nostoc spongiaeforme FACHB-130]|uniref:Uncharacterized protein n=1 Tax=Nostoc spongiaeforme FACHB-130 TaxID=1357510 RepID=A0ABR8FZ22_9NOSO|nr:hypothetical protein [Nostoc spongiaeforme]MBD2596463.1 hypothetical protein [Nostoc spongiaeforme FACHB-130]
MAKLDKFVATVGTAKYAFRAPAGLYDGTIATETGIAVAAEGDQDLPEYKVAELMKKGILRRVNAITRTSAGRPSRIGLLCISTKLATILDALKGDPYSITGGGSGTIVSIGFARRIVSRG